MHDEPERHGGVRLEGDGRPVHDDPVLGILPVLLELAEHDVLQIDVGPLVARQEGV
jgi:hypothetical protein